MENALWYFNVFYTIIIFDYMRKTYGFRYDSKIINAISMVIFYLIHGYINSFHIATINIITDLVMINLFSIILFNYRGEKIYFNAFFQFYLLSLDLIFTGISSLVNNMVFTKTQVHNSYIPYIGANFILLSLTYRMVIKYFQDDYIFFDSARNKKILSIAISIQFAVILLISTLYHYYLLSLIGMIIMFCILFINIFILFSTIFIQANTKTEEIDKLYDEYLLETASIINREKDAKKMLFDICLQHATESRDLKGASQKEVDDYLEKLKEKIDNTAFGYDCGNENMNAIIASIKTKAEKYNINLINDIPAIDLSFIKNKYVIIIILNVVNNAFASIAQEKKLVLKVRQRDNSTLIRITHTCDIKQSMRREDILYPSKMNIVKLRAKAAIIAAKENNGEINFNIDGSNFITTITLFAPLPDHK